VSSIVSFRWGRAVFLRPTLTCATGFSPFHTPHSIAFVKMPDRMFRRSVRVFHDRPAISFCFPDLSTNRGLPFSVSHCSISSARNSPSPPRFVTAGEQVRDLVRRCM